MSHLILIPLCLRKNNVDEETFSANLKSFLLDNHFKDRGSFDRNSLDRNCVLSLDQNYVNHLTKFHLTESVDRIIRSTD